MSFFIHCRNCMPQIPEGVSPAEWARLEVEYNGPASSVTVRCVRCELGIVTFALRQVECPV